MFQPFLYYKDIYIDRLIALDKTILVSQTYSRFRDDFEGAKKTGILLTDYDNMGLAKIHLKAIAHDRFAAIISLENERHKQKLLTMLKPDSPYQVFWSVVDNVKQMEERLKRRYSNNIANYISKNTSWHIGKSETIFAGFQVTYGELYIIVRRGTQSVRVKFEEIEKC